MTRSITDRIAQIIEQEGMGYASVGPAACLAVQYDRLQHDWRIYDDYGDTHVRSLDEAREEIRRWRQAMEANA